MKSKLNLFGRGLSLQIAITVTCQISFIFFGYDQGVFSGIVTNPDWLKTFGHPAGGLLGICVSIYNLGGVTGCIITFLLGERLGRRLCIWAAMCFIIVGAVLQCSSYSLGQLLFARWLTGIGTGIETSTIPAYQSELCSADKRGRLVSSEPLFVGVGIVVSYFTDYGFSYVPGSVGWRVPIALQTMFAFVVIGMVFGIPETPRWLFYHDRPEEAMQVMMDVWDTDENDKEVIKMRSEILETLQFHREHGEYKWSQILKRDDVQTGHRILLAYGMQFMNQLGGINLVVYYVPTVLQDNVGLSHNLALLIGGAVNSMFVVGSLVPTFFLDRLGRRKPMMVGSFGLSICMMMISVLLSFKYMGDKYSSTLDKNTSSAAIAFFFLYMLIFGGTANCVPWVYVPEILPLHARAKGSAVGISSNWLWNFFVVMITPVILDSLKWKAYLIFMCTNLAFVPLVYFFYPETANLSLEEIDYLFTRETPTSSSRAKRFFRPTQPVLESLKPRAQIEADIEADGGLARTSITAASIDEGSHVHVVDEKGSQADEKIE